MIAAPTITEAQVKVIADHLKPFAGAKILLCRTTDVPTARMQTQFVKALNAPPEYPTKRTMACSISRIILMAFPFTSKTLINEDHLPTRLLRRSNLSEFLPALILRRMLHGSTPLMRKPLYVGLARNTA